MIRFVSPKEAHALVEAGAAIVDARGKRELRRGHLPRAVRVDWTGLRDGWGRTARVSDDDARLARRLGAAGIEATRPVLVYGAADHGGGQEGRIAWMLAHLGVRDIALLDGGFHAWREAGLPVARGTPPRPARARFRVRRRDDLRATAADLLAARRRADARILDVRSDEEWRGAMPHFEARGGRIPGAHHLPWKKLLDEDGRLQSAERIAAELEWLGIRRDHEVLVYCAGGVRSAFVWAALRALGWPRVRMYDGSFLEWSKRRALPVEHERPAWGRRLLAWAAGASAVVGAALALRSARQRPA